MRFFLLLTILLVTSCSHMGRSGRYVKVGPRDSLTSLAKRYKVSKELILAANPGKDLQVGELFFIPQNRGILGRTTVQKYLYERSPAQFGSPPSSTTTGFVWPVPTSSKISSSYGRRWGRKHEGVDIPASRGSRIIAAQGGLVVYSGANLGGYGNIIVIGHPNGYFTVYAHNKRNFVAKGQRVMRGQVIGQVGSTGHSTGPHVHFEIRYGGQSYDPMMFVSVPRKTRRYAKR